jgi:hypothetical protein
MDAPGEKWNNINSALRSGCRSLPTGLSLQRLLLKHRGVPKRRTRRPLLTIKQILAWADEHHRRTGFWPTSYSGHVTQASRETWLGVNSALYSGCRGLPGGTSLRQQLIKHGRIKPDRRPSRRRGR